MGSPDTMGDLADVAAKLSADIREIRTPNEEQVAKCAAKLELRGWLKSIAGGENFDKGAKAWAYALINGLGIFVSGPPGTGKTRYLEAVTFGLKHRGVLREFRLKDPRDAEYINRYEYRDYCEETLGYNVLIDDLGAEETVCSYGNRFEPAMDFIFAYMIRGTGNMYINSNLCGKPLLDRYTARIDQLKEHVVPVHFGGPSLRQWTLPL